MVTPGTVQRYLTRNRVDYSLIPHDHSGSSYETARAAHICADHIAKGVLVKDAQGYALVVIPANHWVSLGRLSDQLGRDFVMAAESEVEALFSDCVPGAIPPVGPAYGVETYLDDALSHLADVYFEVGDHEQLVHVNGEGFRSLLRGVRHGYFSHEH